MSTKQSWSDGSVTANAGERLEVVESMIQLFTSGIDRLSEIQKKSLDFAAQQNAEWVGLCKKYATGPSAAPSLALLDLTNSTIERSLDVQKCGVDLMAKQSHVFADLLKERSATACKAADAGMPIVREVIGHVMTAHKSAVDFTAKQAKAALQTAKQQLGSDGSPVHMAVDSMERGVEVLAGAQKELLDAMSEPVQAVQ